MPNPGNNLTPALIELTPAGLKVGELAKASYYIPGIAEILAKHRLPDTLEGLKQLQAHKEQPLKDDMAIILENVKKMAESMKAMHQNLQEIKSLMGIRHD